MSKLKEWLTESTVREQKELAKRADTSLSYLRHLATGFRTSSAELAGRIEDAAKELRRVSKGRLPKITRADISPACSTCPYAKKCKKEK